MSTTSAPVPVSLVVPLYNEETRLVESFRKLAAWVQRQGAGAELILVDDGSVDSTVRAAQTLMSQANETPTRLLCLDHHGKGAAVQAGLLAARGEYRGFCDVDLATPLDELDRLLDSARAKPGSLAIGSREAIGANITQRSRTRQVLGRVYNRILRRAVIAGVRDTQCGAKVAGAPVWTNILRHCEEQGFAWDVEVIALAQQLGITVTEVPVTWCHDDRTTVRPIHDGLAMLAAVRRIRRRVRRVDDTSSAPSGEGPVFDDELGATLHADTTHWWFRAKADAVISELRRTRVRYDPDHLMVDLGAGAGGVTARVQPAIGRAVCIEGSPELSRYASRHANLAAVTATVEDVPLRSSSAAVVMLLDVIEHLDDPRTALEEARRLLAPDGSLVVTVPAHEWLWSRADELLGHRRRYTTSRLQEHLTSAGFHVHTATHLFGWAVAPVWLRRRTTKDPEAQLGVTATPTIVERVAASLCRAERAFLRIGRLPFGTSILAIASPDDASALKKEDKSR